MLSISYLKREGQHQILEKVSTNQHFLFFFFLYLGFFHEHPRFTGQQGKDEAISLTPLYYFHPLHRHLDISRTIPAKSSPLHIASNRTFLVSECKQITTKLRAHFFLLEHLSPNYSKVLLENYIQTDFYTYYVLFTRNEMVHKPSAPAIDKGINALNLIQTLPMFYKSTQHHLLTQPQSKFLL